MLYSRTDKKIDWLRVIFYVYKFCSKQCTLSIVNKDYSTPSYKAIQLSKNFCTSHTDDQNIVHPWFFSVLMFSWWEIRWIFFTTEQKCLVFIFYFYFRLCKNIRYDKGSLEIKITMATVRGGLQPSNLLIHRNLSFLMLKSNYILYHTCSSRWFFSIIFIPVGISLLNISSVHCCQAGLIITSSLFFLILLKLKTKLFIKHHLSFCSCVFISAKATVYSIFLSCMQWERK